MAGCVFAEAVKKGLVQEPNLYTDGQCLGGNGCKACCASTGYAIKAPHRTDYLRQARTLVENNGSGGSLLGVLVAIANAERLHGEQILPPGFSPNRGRRVPRKSRRWFKS